MEAAEPADEFLAAALAAHGIEADDVDMAVMRAVHATFWPPILELLDAELGAVAPEPRPDLSQAPPR